MTVDEKMRKALAHEMRHCNGSMDYARVALEWLQDNGFVQIPREWFIAPDGDGDEVIWMSRPDQANSLCIGQRFMAGNARIEPEVTEWLWENVIRKDEQ